MSFKQQYFEWDIPASQVLYGQPVGFEVQFSQDPSFQKIQTAFSTFNERYAGPIGRMSYSLDNGENWTDFPINDQGVVFNQAYKIRIYVSNVDANSIFVHKDGVIYRISSRMEEILEAFQISQIYTANTFTLNTLKECLCINNGGSTLYRVSTRDALSYYKNSINISGAPIGIVVDSYRNSFWQIERERVSLKDWNGNEMFNLNIPLLDGQLIDIDWSSSSSSESSSSSTSVSSLSSISSDSSASTFSSSSTESIGNTSSSSKSSISSSSSTESIGNTSSSSYSSDSSSSNSSSSSSSSDPILDLHYAILGWETRSVTPSPIFDFDNAATSLVANGTTRFALINAVEDSNFDVARRIQVTTGGKITITGQNSNDFTAQRFTIYKNGILEKDYTNIYYGYAFSYEMTDLQANDIIDIRIRNTNGLDIYNYQIHSDGRIRAKVRGTA